MRKKDLRLDCAYWMERLSLGLLVSILAFLALPKWGTAQTYDSPTYDSYDPYGDDDLDGLSNDEELSYGTDPNKQDTDNDGLWDAEELFGIDITIENGSTSTEILSTDYVYDEATEEYVPVDVYETQIEYMMITVYTDPNIPNDDGDKLPDGLEVANFLNPKDPADGNSDAHDGERVDKFGIPHLHEVIIFKLKLSDSGIFIYMRKPFLKELFGLQFWERITVDLFQ